MDSNTAIVIVAAITTAGALGGIALGALLEGRHRHDDEKRRVYGRVIGVMRERLWDIEKIEEVEEVVAVPTAIRDKYLDQIADPVSIVQLVGGDKVTAAAKDAHGAMMEMFDWEPPAGDDDTQLASWDAVSEAAYGGLKKFIVAAKEDMHLGRHWWKGSSASRN